MANITYDLSWQEAMGDLNEQIHIEDHTLDVEGDNEVPAPPPQATILEAFQHYACLYIKYLQIFERLESCYDQMVHPQKRIDVKQVLEIVMARVIELKHDLVKWNPPNPSIQLQPETNFPWEYVNLDDILVDLKLPPETLEVPVPHFFLEDNAVVIKNRDRLVKGLMKLKLGVDALHLKESHENAIVDEELSLDEAIQIIQKNERGRQGKARATLIKEIREDEQHRRTYEAPTDSTVDPEMAAANIQRIFRGHTSRAAVQAERDEELMFIGMKAPKEEFNALEKKLELAKVKRKVEQTENIEGYEQALIDLKDVVKDEEGPFMRETLLAERREWLTNMIGTGKLPEDLKDFYLMKNPPQDAPKEEEKASDKKKKGKKEEKKGSAKEKGKKKKGAVEPKEVEKPPQLTGPTELTSNMNSAVQQYEKVWLNRDETSNFKQRHDVELAKDVVRDPVEDEIRKQVDETLLLQLANIKAQLETSSGKKGKKGKKGGKKGKKGKKGGKKDKKGKKGKTKALPGDKIAELKGRSTETMMSMLVEERIVYNVKEYHVRDYIGDFNFLGAVHQSADTKNTPWVPQNPSAAQIRQNITEYAILPLGSAFVRKSTKLVRSILLYGAAGSGKTMLVNAIATETGALVLNLSAGNLAGKFTGKTGPTKLVHMAFSIAKDPAMQPVILYIDDCEQIFAAGSSGKKKASSDGPTRFKKDLMTYLGSLTVNDRVMVLGSTCHPENADNKDSKSFFDKIIYLPYPEYASRLIIWNYMIKRQLKEHSARLNIPTAQADKIDMGTLAQISDGYSSGSICQAVNTTITQRRVERMDKRPLCESDFIGPLSRTPRTFQDDQTKFNQFTFSITGLTARISAVKEAKAALAADGADDKKSKKKKK